MFAQAHDAVSTRLHYTRRMGDNSSPTLSTNKGESHYGNDPGEEPQGLAMELRSGGSVISWLGLEGPKLEEAPLSGHL